MKPTIACLSIFPLGLAACSSTVEAPQSVSATPETSTEIGPLLIETYAIDPNRFAVSRELHEVDESIDNAQDAGRLTNYETRKARKQVKLIAREASRLSQDGLTDMEANSLAISARGVESLVNAAAVPDLGASPER